jgi:hypothetical protein
MKNLFKTIFISAIILLASCDSTGLCTEPVTPKLQVGFAQLDELGNEKDISPSKFLYIYGIKDGNEIINENEDFKYLYPNIVTVNNNRIGLILDVNRDESTYVFMYDDGDDQTLNTFDTLKISYSRKQEFVNIECGHKSTFSNAQIHFTTNNINKIELLTDKIDNDIEQHIKIFVN